MPLSARPRTAAAKARQVAPLLANPAPPAPKNNGRSLKHGAWSEKKLAPVRERLVAELSARYPHVSHERLVLQAQRLAQIQVGAAWLDEQDGIVRDKHGRIFFVAESISSWSTTAERWFERADADARELQQRRRHSALAEFLEEDGDG